MSIRWDSAEACVQGRDCPGVIIRSLLPSNAALTQLKTELSTMVAEGIARVAAGAAPPAIVLERPKQARHGDYSTNAALQLAKALKRNPRELAADLVAALPRSPLLARAEVAGAGFVNLFVSDAARQAVVARILDEGDRYGGSTRGGGEKVLVEFVSANPTGPLHVGHGRGAAVGDAIARLLTAQGFAVHREFYYNDAGAQIMNLALSVQARIREAQGIPATFPDDGYRGEYIREIASDYAAANPDDRAADDLEAIRRFAVAILRREQDADLAAFGIRFDHYYLESSLYDEGLADSTVQALIAAGKTYEHEGALWLKTTDYGDDKDRVSRVRAGLQALSIGIPAGYPDYVLHQMVLVMRGGEEVKLSKRAGSGVTLRELIDEVGRDAVRFFFLLRKSDSQLTFDIDLARSQSEENPVYYVQYAHARVCSVLDKAGIDVAAAPQALVDTDLSPLQSPYEQALLNRLADFPEELEAAARELAPHLVTFYLKELAAEFHSYYNAEQFLVDDVALRKARLALVVAVGQVIRNGLALLGVSAPVAMRKEAPNHQDTDR